MYALVFLFAATEAPATLNRPIYFDPPAYDERISRAACGKQEIVVKVRNRKYGQQPALEEVTIDGVAVSAPEKLPEASLFERFTHIDGAGIECEQKSGAPHITFKGFGRQDNAWLAANSACRESGGVWINERWERYEVFEGELHRASTLEPVCARGKSAMAKNSEN